MNDMNQTEITEITDSILETLVDAAPDITTRTMYGGTVFEMEKETPKSRIGGVYSYENYVSVEFATGAGFDDPQNLLEGSGKKRRHIKIHTLKDVADKNCYGFLTQAVAHYLG
jgi:hypothetical protein